MQFLSDLLVPGLVLWLVLQVLYYRRLKAVDGKEFERLGAPSLYFAYSPRTNWLLFGHLFARKFSTSEDLMLRRLGAVLLWFVVAYLVAFVFVVGGSDILK
jgi:hypothetical protein